MESSLNIGCKWSNIAKKLKGRTENSVKNRFKSLIKKERKVRIKNGDKNPLYLDDSTLD
jgi:hypothetical protein